MEQKGFIELVSTLAKRDLDSSELPDWEKGVGEILHIKDGKMSYRPYNTIERLVYGIRKLPLWKIKKALEKLENMELSENSPIRIIQPYMKFYYLLMNETIDFRFIKNIMKNEELRRHMVLFLMKLLRYLPKEKEKFSDTEKKELRKKIAVGILFILKQEDLFVAKNGKVKIREEYREEICYNLSSVFSLAFLNDKSKVKLVSRNAPAQKNTPAKERKIKIII